MRQLIIDIHLIEDNTDDFPTPTVPTALLKGTMTFVGDDVEPAIYATKWLANRMGMELETEGLE